MGSWTWSLTLLVNLDMGSLLERVAFNYFRNKDQETAPKQEVAAPPEAQGPTFCGKSSALLSELDVKELAFWLREEETKTWQVH